MTDKAIIFDMDGTLWDTVEAILPAWNVVLKKYFNETKKQITSAEMESYMGKTLEQIAEISLPHLAKKRSVEIFKECCKSECASLKKSGAYIYPNLIETLNSLKYKYKLMIVSNCQDGYIQAFIEHYNLQKIFSDFECAGHTGKSKGENINLIIERNNIENAFYVGDTQSDFDAAVQADIAFVFAEYGFGNVEKVSYSINVSSIEN